MVVAAVSFLLLELLPVNFTYWQFAGVLLLNGIGMGLFASPNRAGIMNSLPPERRGVGAGMSATFQNSAMLGYNPIQTLLGPVLTRLPASHAAYLTGHSFFPSLISGSFAHGLDIAFDFAIAACLVAAGASLLRGKRYVHDLHGASPAEPAGADRKTVTAAS